MSKEEKTEAKATVDLLGSYFGKSGASWIMQVSQLVHAGGSCTCGCAYLGKQVSVHAISQPLREALCWQWLA
jgi:hypothetical protein